MNLLRSVFAIVFGFLAVFVFAIAADLVLLALLPSAFDSRHLIKSPALLAVALGYTTFFQAVGGYLAARLARRRPQLHALILGAIGLAFAIPLGLAQWSHTPWWYHVGIWLFTLPATWAGGVFFARRATATQSAPAPA